MTFCLNSKIIKPEEKIDNVVILLHGYGGDGNDISMLSLNWKRHLPNTIFICPNGHENCEINPAGYQWFDLTNDEPNHILKEANKAEEILKKFISEVKEEYNLSTDRICLSGFSQGCMMALNVGLTYDEKFNSIVGFSGKIINQVDLKKRIKNPTDIFLIHGELDDIVSPTFMLEAKDFFIREKINIESHMIKNCGHHIPIEASSLALNHILKKFNN